MSVASVIDRLDDLINPIVVKELRQAVKSWLVMGVLLLFLGLQTLVIGVALITQEGRTVEGIDWRAGNHIFTVIQAILLGTCMLLIPVYASIRLGAERSDHNVDLLFISTLAPRSIIAGKFFSAIVLALLVYSACAPFMTFTYLLRGIDIPTILLILGIDLLAMVAATQLALFLAALPVPRVVKVVACVGGFLILVYVFALLAAGCAWMIERGIPNPEEFWWGMGMIALLVLAATAQLFCWSVAVISPPSANRAPAGRICLVSMLALLGVAAAVFVHQMPGLGRERHVVVIFWLVLSVLMFCLQIIISMNERDSWGMRVQRTIPRWWIFRPVAFLLYSGAAGGVILSALGLLATAAVGIYWWRYFESLTPVTGPGGVALPVPDMDPFVEAGQTLIALALFTWCYGLSAVLVRTYLLGDERLRSTYTWAVGLLLVGLGTALPAIAAYIIYFDELHYQNIFPWWNLTNPFATAHELITGYRGYYGDQVVGYDVVLFSFLGLWATLVTALAMPWFIGQMLRFRPPASRPPRALSRVEIVDAALVVPSAENR
jgi:hypothetical protein